MKRLFTLLLSIFVLFCQNTACFAQNRVSLNDLSAFGVKSAKLGRGSSVLDGKIASGEYEDTDWMKIGTGLSLTVNGAYDPSSPDAKQKSYALFDGAYFYLAIEASLPAGQLSAFEKTGVGNVYGTSFSLSAAE